MVNRVAIKKFYHSNIKKSIFSADQTKKSMDNISKSCVILSINNIKIQTSYVTPYMFISIFYFLSSTTYTHVKVTHTNLMTLYLKKGK